MTAMGPVVGSLLILATPMDISPDAGDCAKISTTFEAIVAAVADADSAYRSLSPQTMVVMIAQPSIAVST